MTLPAVPPYEVLAEIGRGGMGVVYRARARDGSEVAIKLPHASSPSEYLRFLREKRLLAKLGSDDGFVALLDAGEEPSSPFLVMPFVGGGTLRERLDRGPLPLEEAVALARRLAGALGRAHALGVVHRDLKPENVLFDSRGRALVADLGLAKHFRCDAPGASQSLSVSDTGKMRGTLRYMAPEQMRDAKAVGPSADVFALGAILYECVTGESPHEAADVSELIRRVQEGRLCPLRAKRPDAPEWLARVADRCLSADPAARFEDGTALERALAQGAHPRSRARDLSLVLGAVAAVALSWEMGSRALAPGTKEDAGDPARAVSALEAEERALLQAGWKPAWSLGGGVPPELSPASLWEGSDGRVASPLRGARLRDATALAAAFLGKARAAPGGQVVVAYDLGRALHASPSEPGSFVAVSSPGAETIVDGPGVESVATVRIRADADSGGARVGVGSARWREARVLARVDPGPASPPARWQSFSVSLGDRSSCSLATIPFQGLAQVGSATTAFTFGEGGYTIELAPLAAPGGRVKLAGVPVPALDVAVRASAGPVTFWVSAGSWALSSVEVDGIPERPDVPAASYAPRPLTGGERVAAEFARDRPGSGGPFVALGDRREDELRLELDGERLVLSHGDSLLAAVAVPGPVEEGWIALERTGAVVSAVALAGGALRRLSVVDPLPLAGERVRASYGSTAPRVAFGDVRVHERPTAGKLRGDGAASGCRDDESLGALEQPPVAPASAWRAGAIRLARVADPRRLDPALVGREAAGARRAAAAAARDRLVAAALGLADLPARRDALARAVFASVLAGDAAQAEALAERLAREHGQEGTSALDALERDGERPSLVDRLACGYGPYFRSPAAHPEEADVALAGLAAALVLAPDRRGKIAFVQARCLASGVDAIGRAGAGAVPPLVFSAADRVQLDRALGKLDVAASAGHDVAETAALRGDLLFFLERNEEALRSWDEAVAARPGHWWGWVRRAQILSRLDRPREACESMLGALANAVKGSAQDGCIDGILGPGRAGEGGTAEMAANAGFPGLAAANLATLADLVADPPGGALRTRALALARGASTSSDARERDLALYVLARSGERAPGPDAFATLPLSVLARERGKARPSADAIRGAAGEDRLVEHLVRLDPYLAPLLAR